MGSFLLSLVKFPLAVWEKKSFCLYDSIKIATPERGQIWPHGYNLNKIGRFPLDNVIYKIWKLCVYSFKQEYFEKMRFGNLFYPVVYLHCMQLIRTVWTTFVEEHLGIIDVKVGRNPMSVFRETSFEWKRLSPHVRTHANTHAPMDGGQRTDTIAYSEHFDLRSLCTALPVMSRNIHTMLGVIWTYSGVTLRTINA